MYTTNPDKQFIDIIASSLANDTQVKIKAGEAWACDVKNKVLVYKESDLLDMPFYSIRGLLVHEIGHINHTSPKNVVSKYRKLYPKAMHNIYNCYEDRRMEDAIISGTYTSSSFRNYARESLGLLNSYILEENIKHDVYKKMTRLEQFLHGSSIVLAKKQFNAVNKNKVIPCSISSLSDIGICQDVIDRISTLYSSISYLTYCDSSTELQSEINSMIVPHIEDYLKEQDKQDKKQASKGKGKQGQQGKDRDKMIKTLTSGKKLSYLDKTLDNIDFQYIGQAEAKIMLQSSINLLSRHLKSVLEARRTTKYTGAYNRGKLINKNIYKVGIKADRPFTKKLIHTQPDNYHVFLFLDNSGSMSRIAGQAMLAGHLLEQSLDKVNIPCTIVEFSTTDDTKILKSIDDYSVRGGHTMDNKALELVVDKIESNSKQGIDNILFSITDGVIELCETRDSLLHKIVKQLDTKLIGIGIGGVDLANINRSYPMGSNIEVKDIKDLPDILAKTLKNLISN